MAEFIPSNLNQTDATSGEKKVFKFLQHLFSDDDRVCIWYEPEALGRYSDFLIWHPAWGLLAIEVKDWSKSHFIHIDKLYFSGTFYKNGQVTSVANPNVQARQFSLKLINQCKQNAAFINPQGQYQGKLIFPVTYAVFYTHLTRHDAKEMELLHPSITPAQKALFKDELELDLNDAVIREQTKQRLQAAFEGFSFNFHPLSYAQEKALRYMIFPEIRVNHLTQDDLFKAQAQDFKALDLQQESVAKNIGEGHRILKGVAGSGKSLVLASRARCLRQIYPDWKILVVCFNNTLCNHIKNMLGTVQHIDVQNFHGVVKSITQANVGFKMGEKSEDYDQRIVGLLQDYLDEHPHTHPYDAILIDEGQDFSQEWIQLLTKLVNPNTNSILFCYDPAQNIFNRTKPSWKSVGLQVQGKRPIELLKCYRNTKEILDIARDFLNPKQIGSLQGQDIYDRVLNPDTGECRKGHYPISHYEPVRETLLNSIAKKVARLIQQGTAPKEVAILRAYDTAHKQDEQWLNQAFAAHAQSVQLEWVTSSSAKKKLNLDTDSVKVLNLESCKGLEFKHVFCLGLEQMPRAKREAETERKLAYVALTRAQEYLYLLASQKQGFYQELHTLLEQHQNLPSVPVPTQVKLDSTEIQSSSKTGKAYQPWDEDEEVRLIDAFMLEQLPLKEIAKRLERSEGAVSSRLKKLRLLE